VVIGFLVDNHPNCLLFWQHQFCWRCESSDHCYYCFSSYFLLVDKSFLTLRECEYAGHSVHIIVIFSIRSLCSACFLLALRCYRICLYLILTYYVKFTIGDTLIRKIVKHLCCFAT